MSSQMCPPRGTTLSRHSLLQANKINGLPHASPLEVLKMGQAELGAHVGEAAHQEGALIHPLLNTAEWVFDDLAAAVENRRSRFEALGHAIENVLVFEAEN